MTKIGVMEMRDEGVVDKNNLRLQNVGSLAINLNIKI